MADALMFERSRVHWGPVVAGAFFAVATATVLGLFGAAFGRAGVTVLSGVWQILTPLVAGFVGAAVAASLAGSAAYLNGILVWALSIAYGGAIMALSASRVGGGAAERMAAVPPAGTLALAGLATLLGLIGALIGSAIGGRLEQRIALRAEQRPAEDRTHRAAPVPERPVAAARGTPPAEPPELRH